MKIFQKTIVVTGAGSGIGKALSLALLQGGARVAAVDIQEAGLASLQSAAAKAADRLSLHQLDISNRNAAEALPAAVVAAHGQVDGLINNAGIIQPFVKVHELDYAVIEKVMNVNFYGTLYLTKAFLPFLLKRPEAHIVNISSMGGFLPVPGQSIYGSAKAAVKLFTEGLHAELAGSQVRVTIVFPGAIATNITTNSGVEVPKMASANKTKSFKALPAQKAAALILAGMEKNAFRVLVGSDARFMDLIYRLHPRRAAAFISKKMADLLAV
jgi:short-subunit dehydrogenase